MRAREYFFGDFFTRDGIYLPSPRRQRQLFFIHLCDSRRLFDTDFTDFHGLIFPSVVIREIRV